MGVVDAQNLCKRICFLQKEMLHGACSVLNKDLSGSRRLALLAIFEEGTLYEYVASFGIRLGACRK
jgi:hypothetical protein